MNIEKNRKNYVHVLFPLLSFSSFRFSLFSLPSLSSQDLKILMQHGVEEDAGKGMMSCHPKWQGYGRFTLKLPG